MIRWMGWDGMVVPHIPPPAWARVLSQRAVYESWGTLLSWLEQRGPGWKHSAQHIHYPLPVSYTHLPVYLGTFYGGSTDVFIMCENSHELVPGGNQTYLQLLGQRRLVLLTLMLLLLLFVGSTSLPVAPKREIPEEKVVR